MEFRISFKNVCYSLCIGSSSAVHQQLWKISLVKEYYEYNEQVFAKVLFCK